MQFIFSLTLIASRKGSLTKICYSILYSLAHLISYECFSLLIKDLYISFYWVLGTFVINLSLSKHPFSPESGLLGRYFHVLTRHH